MSMITMFYNKYVENESCGGSEVKGELVGRLGEKIKDVMYVEETITKLEDEAAEKAFNAGFKTAFALIAEVLI